MDYQENNKYKIIWLNSFKNDLSHIYYYLSYKLKEPSIANKFHSKVFKTLSTLSYFPERFPLLKHNKNIRKISIDKYVVLYTVKHNTRSSLYFAHLSW